MSDTPAPSRRPEASPERSSALPSVGEPLSGVDVDALLATFLAGTLPAADRGHFERWLDAEPGRRAIVAALRGGGVERAGAGEAGVRTPAVLPGPIDVHAWWRAVGASLVSAGDGAAVRDAPRRAPLAVVRSERAVAAERPRSTPVLRRWHGRPARLGRPVWWAAAAAVVVGAAWLEARVGPWAGPGSAHGAAVRTYVTARGERAVLTLEGARVVLAPESELRVGADYGDRVRAVTLRGHAFFDVVHDSARPFRVRTQSLVTEDMGTRFDIRAYPGGAAAQVIVADGSVAVARPAGGAVERLVGATIVRRGSRMMLDTSGAMRVVSGLAVERDIAWADGRLAFVDVPLGDVVRELGRWYDVDWRLADPDLRTRRLTATFAGDPVEDVVHAIERALGVRARWSGRTVTLFPP